MAANTLRLIVLGNAETGAQLALVGALAAIAGRKGEGATAADIRWFKRDNCFASHVMNAFQEGTKIHFDTPEAKNNMFPFFPDIHGAPFNPIEAASFLTRWTVDMASNSDAFESMTRLSNMIGEFPRIDDRFAGQPYRDTQSGFRIYPRRLFDRSRFRTHRFETETELLLYAAKLGIPLVEVPVRTIYQPGRVTHFHGFTDTLRVIRLVLFSPLWNRES